MNFNIFKKKENSASESQELQKEESVIENEAAIEEKEDEMSPERIEALKELDEMTAEIASLKESDLVEDITDPEKRKELKDKVSTLSKIAEKIKAMAPEVVSAAVALGGVVLMLEGNGVDTEVVGHSTVNAPFALHSAMIVIGSITSGLLHSARKNREAVQSNSANMNNLDQKAA